MFVVQSEREASEQTLANTAKTHDRMKNEQRGWLHVCFVVYYTSYPLTLVSPYFKQKLQGLYQTALQDAKRELTYVFNLSVAFTVLLLSTSSLQAG